MSLLQAHAKLTTSSFQAKGLNINSHYPFIHDNLVTKDAYFALVPRNVSILNHFI